MANGYKNLTYINSDGDEFFDIYKDGQAIDDQQNIVIYWEK